MPSSLAWKNWRNSYKRCLEMIWSVESGWPAARCIHPRSTAKRQWSCGIPRATGKLLLHRYCTAETGWDSRKYLWPRAEYKSTASGWHQVYTRRQAGIPSTSFRTGAPGTGFCNMGWVPHRFCAALPHHPALLGSICSSPERCSLSSACPSTKEMGMCEEFGAFILCWDK